ncbi:MAG: putative Ig domain-containing protein [Pseudomonadota bacterium]
MMKLACLAVGLAITSGYQVADAKKMDHDDDISFSYIQVIDFEGIFPGEIIDDEYEFLGLTISAENFSNGPDLAVLFDSFAPTGGDDDLGAPFLFEQKLPNYPGNILIIQENANGCNGVYCDEPDDEGSRPGGRFTFEFESPVNFLNIDVFDIEYEEGNNSNNQVIFYDENNSIISQSKLPNTGDNGWNAMSFDVDGVSTMTIDLPGSGALDKLVFETNYDPCTCFPHFTSSPMKSVKAGSRYSYKLQAESPEGEELRYRLREYPEGMRLNPRTGELTWRTPRSSRNSRSHYNRYQSRGMKRADIAQTVQESWVTVEAISASGKTTKQRFKVKVTR